MKWYALSLTVVLAGFGTACGPCENPKTHCVRCGPADGCLESEEYCADDTSCDANDDCDDDMTCHAGYCISGLICG